MENNTSLRIIQFILVAIILILTTVFTYYIRRNKINIFDRFGTGFLIGLATDFGDFFGVGSFATTTGLFKATKYNEDDRKLPATLNAVHVIPTIFQALLSMTIIKVDLTTLIPLAIANAAGAYVGPRVTKNWNVRAVRRALAIILITAAILVLVRFFILPGAIEQIYENFNIDPTATGLGTGGLLIFAMIFNFILGILMTIGFGNYTPQLIFFSLVGVNPAIAFPVMMFNASVSMTVAVYQFIRDGRIEWKGLAPIAIGGSIGVFIAAWILAINENAGLPETVLSVLIVSISIWTAYTLIQENRKEGKKNA